MVLPKFYFDTDIKTGVKNITNIRQKLWQNRFYFLFRLFKTKKIKQAKSLSNSAVD